MYLYIFDADMDHLLGYKEALKEGAGRLLFDTAAEGLLIVNAEGTIVVTNQRINEMFGYGDGELQGLSMEVLVPRELREKHVDHRDAYKAAPKKRSMGQGRDLSAVRKDGTEFPVEVSLNHYKQGGQLFVMALVTDISDRKRAERELQQMNQTLEQMVDERTRELRESQHLYRTIARNFPNGTINVFDRNLRYVFAEGQELFRYRLTSEALTGTSYLDRLPPDLKKEIEPQLRKVFEGEDMTFEVETRGDSYQLNAVGLPDSNGEVHQILVVEQNISTQKKAQEKIRISLDKERELNELKSRFVSMASHEFRTPLSTILSSVSLLRRYNETDELAKREKHLGRIRTAVQNLTNILNDFLSLDKLEEGRIQSNPTEVDLNRLLLDVVEEMEPHCKSGQSIVLEAQEGMTIYSDEHIMRNILINLLSNAIKYSPEQSNITLQGRIENKRLIVAVIDRGIGIPESEQEHLFTRFFRASNAINFQGTGLGLHIVKRYIELLNGELEFVSKLGEGTTFKLSFPIEE